MKSKLPEWAQPLKAVSKPKAPVLSRQQVMTRKRFNRFMAGVPLEVAINHPKGAW